ncbi:tyrosine-protein kinase receptor Tie-1 [Prionailurus iriomotensis]
MAACLPGFYGLDCAHICDCKNGASCDAVNGQCICPAGFHGSQCEKGIARAFLDIWEFCVTMRSFQLRAKIQTPIENME